MQIVTIISDYGNRDPYAAMLKGYILQRHCDLKIIDISHEVQPYHILEGSFMLQSCYTAFPRGTIHLFCVNQAYDSDPILVVAKVDDHYFVGPDNGFLDLMFPDRRLPAGRRFALQDRQNWHQLYAEVVHALATAQPWSTIGEVQETFRPAMALRPVVSDDFIRAVVTHIDHYGNVLLNIDRDTFEEVRDGRSFALYYQRRHPIKSLVERYHDVGESEILARFNSRGILEIAIYLGNAAQLLGIVVDQLVQIDFLPKEVPSVG